MTAPVTESLRQIERSLLELNRSMLLRLLRPGERAWIVKRELARRGLRSDADLEALWGWRCGTDASGEQALDDLHLLPGFYLLSLEDALANYDAFMPDPRWVHGGLPLLANGGGDFLVVDLGGADVGTRAQVRHFRIDEGEHPVEYESVADMLATFAAAFTSNVFYVDPRGYLELNDEVFAALAAEHNPSVDWWCQA